MDYKLAKQLKEAGFPQKTEYQFIKTFGGNIRAWNSCEMSEFKTAKIQRLNVACPTLSELIEACKEDCWEINQTIDNKWQAWEHNRCGKMGKGKTPEVAVAKLFLKLNPKP